MFSFLGEICKPAELYLVLNIIIVLSTIAYNISYNIIPVGAAIIIGLFAFIYILIWTYIFKFLCNSVSVTLVWILFFLNIVFLVIRTIFEINNMKVTVQNSKTVIDASGTKVK